MIMTQQKIIATITIALIGILLYCLKPILTPFLVAGLLAYLSDPLVNKLSRTWFPRTGAVIIVFIGIFIAILLLVLMLVPILERQFTVLIAKLPQLLLWIQQTVVPWFHRHFDMVDAWDFNAFRTALTEHWQQAGNVAAAVVKTITYSGHTVITWLLNLFLIPVVTFYLLRDWDLVVREAKLLIPRKTEPLIIRLFNECNEVLGAFFRGQLVVMLVLGLVYALGLWFCGIEVALLVGILSGLLSIVPYLGFIVGILTASIAALIQYQDAIHVVYVLIVYIIGHIIEGFILTPWLVGDKIGLHPVAVIFAILAGGQLFGFIGVLVALPVAAVIMVLVRYLKQQYTQSQLYHT